MTQRGSIEHLSEDAQVLLRSKAVEHVFGRLQAVCEARLRGADLADAEECRGAVAAFQAQAATRAYLESLAVRNEVSDIADQRKQEVV